MRVRLLTTCILDIYADTTVTHLRTSAITHFSLCAPLVRHTKTAPVSLLLPPADDGAVYTSTHTHILTKRRDGRWPEVGPSSRDGSAGGGPVRARATFHTATGERRTSRAHGTHFACGSKERVDERMSVVLVSGLCRLCSHGQKCVTLWRGVHKIGRG